MKNRFILFSSFAALAMAIGTFCGGAKNTVTRAEDNVVAYHADESKWETKTSATFTDSYMQSSTSQFDWATGMNNFTSFEFEVTESLVMSRDADWKYEYLTISTTGGYGVDAAGVTQANNSVSLVWGWIPYAQFVEKDVVGTSTIKSVGYGDKDIPLDFADDNYATSFFRHTFDRSFKIKVTIVELQDAVRFDFILSGSDEWGAYPSGITVSFSYTSTNKSLKGARSIAYGRLGSGTVDDTHTIKATLNVTESSGDNPISDDYINYTADESLLHSMTGASINGTAVSMTSTNSRVVTNEFEGNATIKYAIDFTKVAGTWGGMAFMFKGSTSDMDAATWSFDFSNNTDQVSVSNNGNWVAFKMSHSEVGLLSCVDGVVSSLPYNFGTLNGYSFWYLTHQLTELTVTTVDTADGVSFALVFKASGNAANLNESYTCNFSIDNKGLWGVQSAGFMLIAGDGTYDATTNTVTIKAISEASGYSSDTRLVEKFHDLVGQINYTSITEDNYSTLSALYDSIMEFYNSLSDTVKASLAVEDVAILTKLHDDLASCDTAFFAQIAINNLNIVAFTRDNYESQKEAINDANAKYEALTPDQKETIENKDKLFDALAALLDFEDLLIHADPVVELIDAITLPISNYGKDKRAIELAKKEYDNLFPEEQELVYNYQNLVDALEALAQYKREHQNPFYNFATSVDNFAETSTFANFSTSGNGLRIGGNSNEAAIYPTMAVPSEKEVTYAIDSGLTDSLWGNFYFVFRSDSMEQHHFGGNWLQKGNYAVLLVGSDGFKVGECIDGVFPMTTDSFGNPIGDFKTVLSDVTTEEGTNYDVWYAYKNYTTLKIKTVDNYEGTTYVGYTATITLIGGESGGTIVRSFTSTNPHSKDAGYTGMEIFSGAPINNGNGLGFLLEGLYIEDVTDYNGAAAKEEARARQYAAEVDALLNNLSTETITKDNYESIKTAYEIAKAAYDELTDTEKSYLTVDPTILDTVKANIAAYEASAKAEEEKAHAEAVDTLLNALILDVNESNYDDAVAAYEAAKAAYDDLTDSEKALLTVDPSILEQAKAAIDNYVPPVDSSEVDESSEEEVSSATSEVSSKQETSSSSEDKPTNGGCGGSIVTVSALVSLISIAGIAIFKRRKEN